MGPEPFGAIIQARKNLAQLVGAELRPIFRYAGAIAGRRRLLSNHIHFKLMNDDTH
jgi:hypothetical protein